MLFLSVCVVFTPSVCRSVLLVLLRLSGVRLTWWSHTVGDAVLRQVSHRAMLWASYGNKDALRSSPLQLSSTALLTAASSSPHPPSLPSLPPPHRAASSHFPPSLSLFLCLSSLFHFPNSQRLFLFSIRTMVPFCIFLAFVDSGCRAAIWLIYWENKWHLDKSI